MYNLNDHKYYMSDLRRIEIKNKKLNQELKLHKNTSFFYDNIIDKEINNLKESINKKNEFLYDYNQAKLEFINQSIRRNKSMAELPINKMKKK